jgi:hypothetical protein
MLLIIYALAQSSESFVLTESGISIFGQMQKNHGVGWFGTSQVGRCKPGELQQWAEAMRLPTEFQV